MMLAVAVQSDSIKGAEVSDKVTSLSLLERLRDSSDDEAWRQFHDLYGPLIRYWLVRRGVQSQDAEDVQQEVMQLAAGELAKFQHSGRIGALRCWLRQVVANRLRTFWRQKNRQGLALGGSDYAALADQLEDPHSELSRVWDEEYQQTMCARLLELVQGEFQAQTMAAFRGVAVEGRKAAEVGEELQMSTNAVRIAQSRVLRRLRELAQGMLD